MLPCLACSLIKQELQALQNRFDKVDGEATELKLQVVELQLEKADCEQRLEREAAHLQVCICACELVVSLLISCKQAGQRVCTCMSTFSGTVSGGGEREGGGREGMESEKRRT